MYHPFGSDISEASCVTRGGGEYMYVPYILYTN